MPSDDRDQQFDRALARHLRSASPDAACPDAEILAAYHERALSLEEMAHWKTHIVSCARCQETLALLEQTDSVAANDWEKKEMPGAMQAGSSQPTSEDIAEEKPASEVRAGNAVPAPLEIRNAAKLSPQTRRRVPWSIVVPAGTLAAGLLVWVAVHESPRFARQEKASVQVAENREAASPASSSIPEAGKVEARDEGSAALQSYARADHKSTTPLTTPALPSKESPAARIVPPPPAPQELAKSETDRLKQLDAAKGTDSFQAGAGVGAVTRRKEPAATPAAPMAAPGRAGGPLVSNQTQNQAQTQMQNQIANQNSNLVPAPPANQATGGSVNQAADQSKVRAEKQSVAEKKKDVQEAPKGVTETVSVAASSEAVEVTSAETSLTNSDLSSAAPGARQFSSLLLLASNFIAAPDKKHGWRIGPSGKIEHSTDAGKSWKAQKSGVTADLLTGSAPSEKVCWIAGKAGTLLLTTDGGKHWKQLAPPISEDLGGVRALDAQHVFIWDVSRVKTFETSDGGLTWTQVANQ